MRSIMLSVRKLVESMLMSGDLGTEGLMLSPQRAQEGSRVHRSHQERQQQEDSTYEREVFLKHTFEFEDLAITLEGRADGILPGQYIEEIKSTYLDKDTLERYENPLHWAQLLVYGYLYALDQEKKVLPLRLTYIHVETAERTHRERNYSFEELETFVQEVLDRFVFFRRLELSWRIRRNQSIASLPFPFSTYRLGQRELAVSVYGTIREAKKLFVQAPTGIGKTISTLFPAVKALGEGKIDRIFYLTPKSTGKAIGEESVARMRRSGASLRSITLTSKEKICFMEQVRCEASECPYAKGFYDRLQEALRDILVEEESFSRSVVEAYAQKHQICPFEFALELSLYADIIIGDYNYAFDPRVYLKRFFDEKSERYAFLVDEAHNLLDRARSMFSAALVLEEFQAFEESLPAKQAALKRRSQNFLQAFRSVQEALGDEGRVATPEPPQELIEAAECFRDALQKVLEEEQAGAQELQEEREALLAHYFELIGFLRIAELYGPGHVTYFEQTKEHFLCKLFCLDPAPNLKAASLRADSIVFFSATLSPMQYYMDLYAGTEADYRMRLPSPFPKEHLTVYCDERIDTRYRVRPQSYEAIAENLAWMVRQKKGNYIAFFPSYRYLENVFEVFDARYGKVCDYKAQTPGQSEGQRLEVLKTFSQARDESLLYFMVLGGVFSEGIDLKGDQLIGCALIGLGYPPLDYERELLLQFFEADRGQGFAYAYTYPGLSKITQAGGRVIRSETDEGLLFLMDTRYQMSDIQHLLPSAWLPMAKPPARGPQEANVQEGP
ncbi:DinG family ATP-dependent helicase [Clostridiaceae bacterium JG1575]|nr:DinG family ATP-dependent helicase [Clostridiaceae bacterium JG1575]